MNDDNFDDNLEEDDISVDHVDLSMSTEEGYKYDNLDDAAISKTNVVGQFRQAWGKRRNKLVHDYSVT